jgi:excisionase family DNA binding protein
VSFEKLYSVKAAAERLGDLSVWTIYSWLGSGRLRGNKVGRRILIPESELQRLLDCGKKSKGLK